MLHKRNFLGNSLGKKGWTKLVGFLSADPGTKESSRKRSGIPNEKSVWKSVQEYPRYTVEKYMGDVEVNMLIWQNNVRQSFKKSNNLY